VTLHRYEDALEVTEAAPLVSYILSMGSLRGVRAGDLERRVEQVLAERGSIRITKETGLFEARVAG
jgi:hypothetical protein